MGSIRGGIRTPLVAATGGQVDSVQAGTGIAVDATDPVNPIVSSLVVDTNLADTDFTIDSITRTFTGENNSTIEFVFYDTDASDYSHRSRIKIIPTGITLEYSSGDGGGGSEGLRILDLGNAVSALFTDGVNQKGIEYAADYSGNFTAQSLVDKEYVDGVAPASSFSTNISTEADMAAFGSPGGEYIVTTNLHFLESISWATDSFITFQNGASYSSASTHQNIIQTGDRAAGAFLNINGVAAGRGVAWDNVGGGAGIEVNAPFASFDFLGSRCIKKMDLINCGRMTIDESCGILQGGLIEVSGTFNSLYISNSAIQTTTSGTKLILIKATAEMQILSIGEASFLSVGFGPPATGISLIYIEKGAQIGTLQAMGGAFAELVASSGNAAIVMQDPSDVGLGIMEGISAQMGTSDVFGMDPVADTTFAAGFNPQGCTVDGDNRLIVVDSDAGEFVRYTGINSTEDTRIVIGIANTQAVGWWRGNLMDVGASNSIARLHAGFTTTIDESTDALNGLTNGPNNPVAIETDGSQFILANSSGPTIYVFPPDFFTAATTPEPSFFYDITGLGFAGDITWTGTHLEVTDVVSGLIYVQRGLTSETIYTIDPADVASLKGITNHDNGVVLTSQVTDEIDIYDSFFVLDYSANTWDMRDNIDGNFIDSSDRGGSIFGSPIQINVATPDGEGWVDVIGTGLVYGNFSEREKSRLNDELTGEIIWTGGRKRARQIVANLTAESSGSGGTFQLAISINGVIQYDSSGQEIYTTPSDTKTIRTTPVARDLEEGDLIKMQVRLLVDTGLSLDTFACKLSIS